MPTNDPKKQKAFTQIYYSYNNQILYYVVNAKQKLGMRTTVILSHPAAITSNDAMWTNPWRNFFQYFDIMVSNDSMNPETLFEHD